MMRSNIIRGLLSPPWGGSKLWPGVLALGLLVGMGCTEPSTPEGPSVDSNSNWLSVCVEDSDCAAGTSCLCGVCTVTCASGACEDARDGTCVEAGSAQQESLCLSGPVADGVCLPECTELADCGTGFTCVEQTCQPLLDTREALCRDDSRCADDERCIEACEGTEGDAECQVTCRPGSECVAGACQPLSCDSRTVYSCAEDLGLAGEVLFECVDGQLLFAVECAGECSTHDRRAGCADACPAGTGTYCGQRGENPDILYRCEDGVYTPDTRCSNGCVGADGSASCGR